MALAKVSDVPAISEPGLRDWRLAGGLLLTLASGCGPSAEVCEVQRVASAIVHGHPRTDYLGLAEAEARALLAIELLRSGEIRDLCSGVALTSELVLTAAHCVDDSVVELAVAGRTWQRWG